MTHCATSTLPTHHPFCRVTATNAQRTTNLKEKKEGFKFFLIVLFVHNRPIFHGTTIQLNIFALLILQIQVGKKTTPGFFGTSASHAMSPVTFFIILFTPVSGSYHVVLFYLFVYNTAFPLQVRKFDGIIGQ